MSVRGLLSDETLDRCLQLGIVDGTLEVPDRADEEILAFRAPDPTVPRLAEADETR